MNKQTNLEKLQEEMDEEIDDKCPFAPAISNNSRAIFEKKKIKPVYDRYKDEIKAKKERIEKLKSELDQQKIDRDEKENTISNKSTNKKFHDTYKHNVAWYNKKTQKIVDEQVKRLEEALQEKEHKPQVNSKSIRAMEGTTFEERQLSFVQRVQNKKQELDRKANNHSHSPNLNQKSMKMAEEGKQRRMIREMVYAIEENERRQEEEAEKAERMMFRDSSKPRAKSTIKSENNRLYKTPGKKKVIVALPQKSRNPTLDKKDKTNKDIASLRKSSPSHSPDRNSFKSPSRSNLKKGEASRSVKFVEDEGQKPVVQSLRDKGNLVQAQ